VGRHSPRRRDGPAAVGDETLGRLGDAPDRMRFLTRDRAEFDEQSERPHDNKVCKK